jgi:hypothetical protein
MFGLITRQVSWNQILNMKSSVGQEERCRNAQGINNCKFQGVHTRAKKPGKVEWEGELTRQLSKNRTMYI